MITRQDYDAAVELRKQCESVIREFDSQESMKFMERFTSGVPFTDEELVYSESTLCPCGHGLAYPVGCGGFHYWDCSARLKGIADKAAGHTEQLPFSFYNIRAEGERFSTSMTTRGVFRPRDPVPTEMPTDYHQNDKVNVTVKEPPMDPPTIRVAAGSESKTQTFLNHAEEDGPI